ncbi:hypothetical protein [Paenibacillus sp. JNUCC31]|uniref:hypothetical protein n=1 Tax=Paenibacillus sp. JNUCC-31 TaxID=2777983 RepID=UPI001E3CB23B|nr:hypothetical protein [Paenibacillus sp. JNUCC-31]
MLFKPGYLIILPFPRLIKDQTISFPIAPDHSLCKRLVSCNRREIPIQAILHLAVQEEREYIEI